MPGTLTYPIYAGVDSLPPRRRAYTWNAQHRSASRVAEVNAQLGRVSLSESSVRQLTCMLRKFKDFQKVFYLALGTFSLNNI